MVIMNAFGLYTAHQPHLGDGICPWLSHLGTACRSTVLSGRLFRPIKPLPLREWTIQSTWKRLNLTASCYQCRCHRLIRRAVCLWAQSTSNQVINNIECGMLHVTVCFQHILYDDFLTGISKNIFFVPLYKKVQWLAIVECRFLLSSAFSFQNFYKRPTGLCIKIAITQILVSMRPMAFFKYICP